MADKNNPLGFKWIWSRLDNLHSVICKAADCLCKLADREDKFAVVDPAAGTVTDADGNVLTVSSETDTVVRSYIMGDKLVWYSFDATTNPPPAGTVITAPPTGGTFVNEIGFTGGIIPDGSGGYTVADSDTDTDTDVTCKITNNPLPNGDIEVIETCYDIDGNVIGNPVVKFVIPAGGNSVLTNRTSNDQVQNHIANGVTTPINDYDPNEAPNNDLTSNTYGGAIDELSLKGRYWSQTGAQRNLSQNANYVESELSHTGNTNIVDGQFRVDYPHATSNEFDDVFETFGANNELRNSANGVSLFLKGGTNRNGTQAYTIRPDGNTGENNFGFQLANLRPNGARKNCLYMRANLNNRDLYPHPNAGQFGIDAIGGASTIKGIVIDSYGNYGSNGGSSSHLFSGETNLITHGMQQASVNTFPTDGGTATGRDFVWMGAFESSATPSPQSLPSTGAEWWVYDGQGSVTLLSPHQEDLARALGFTSSVGQYSVNTITMIGLAIQGSKKALFDITTGDFAVYEDSDLVGGKGFVCDRSCTTIEIEGVTPIETGNTEYACYCDTYPLLVPPKPVATEAKRKTLAKTNSRAENMLVGLTAEDRFDYGNTRAEKLIISRQESYDSELKDHDDNTKAWKKEYESETLEEAIEKYNEKVSEYKKSYDEFLVETSKKNELMRKYEIKVEVAEVMGTEKPEKPALPPLEEPIFNAKRPVPMPELPEDFPAERPADFVALPNPFKK